MNLSALVSITKRYNVLYCRICNIGLYDMMTAVVILKEFEKRRLITEVVKGVWIRSPSGAPGEAHGKSEGKNTQ